MSLMRDIKNHYEDNTHPPEDLVLDMEYLDDEWVSKGTSTEQVSFEVIDTSPRWGNRIQAVYRRGDEYVAIEDIEPATEMQDWGDYGDPEIYHCRPVEVTITKYERV